MVFYWTGIQSLKTLWEIIKQNKIYGIRIRTHDVKRTEIDVQLPEIGVLEGVKIHTVSEEGI